MSDVAELRARQAQQREASRRVIAEAWTKHAEAVEALSTALESEVRSDPQEGHLADTQANDGGRKLAATVQEAVGDVVSRERNIRTAEAQIPLLWEGDPLLEELGPRPTDHGRGLIWQERARALVRDDILGEEARSVDGGALDGLPTPSQSLRDHVFSGVKAVTEAPEDNRGRQTRSALGLTKLLGAAPPLTAPTELALWATVARTVQSVDNESGPDRADEIIADARSSHDRVPDQADEPAGHQLFVLARSRHAILDAAASAGLTQASARSSVANGSQSITVGG